MIVPNLPVALTTKMTNKPTNIIRVYLIINSDSGNVIKIKI